MSSFFNFDLFNAHRKSDLNEDINRMLLYIQKNYSPADRVKLVEGVKDGIKKGLEIEKETAKEKQESAEIALVLLSNI